MNNLWSENKYVNVIINVLLYLLGINIMHYGQLLLPLICAILFVNNKFRFKVVNTNLFIVLCLFSISFFAFSYKLGFYSVMGFTLPMAYYIGSNIYEPNEKKVKYVIYIIAFGMASYLMLNMFYELIKFGIPRFFIKVSRYDVWLRSEIKSTSISIYSVLIISMFSYILFKEKEKNLKNIGILLFVISLFYCAVIGKRTSIMLTVIIFAFSIVLDILCFKNLKNVKSIIYLGIFILIGLTIFGILYFHNVFGIQDLLGVNNVIQSFLHKGLKADRFIITIRGMKYLPSYPWGGQYISDIIGYPFHDLLFDIYDYAGIVPFILMAIICVYNLRIITKIVVEKKINSDIKNLFLCVILSICLMFFMEPIMTGCSLFLICVTIIITSMDSLLKERKVNFE